VVYNALDGTLSMKLAEAFLELRLGMEGKHVAIPVVAW